MSGGGKDRTSREARERARLYDARRALHEGQGRRLSRDNLIAGIAGGVIVVAIAVAQTLYFTTGPGAPTPTPTATTPAPTPSATPSADPSASPIPEPTTTP